MTYTVRYAHLEHPSQVAIGFSVKRGDKIGRIGNTGQSAGIHLHIDCVENRWTGVYHMIDQEEHYALPAYKQLLYFIDDELFDYSIQVTSHFCDKEYFEIYGKVHMGFDVIPCNGGRTTRNFDFFWNRTMHGEIIANGFDSSYGNYVNIAFEAGER